MFKKFSIILVTSAIILAGCGLVKTTDNKTGDDTQEKYTNEINGFTLEHTSKWATKSTPETENVVAVMLMAKVKDSEKDLFNENLNIIVQDLNVDGLKDLDLQKYSEKNTADIQNTIVDVEISEKKDLEIGGMPAKMIVFTGKFGESSLKWAQAYAIKDSKGYIFTFTDSPDDFATHVKYYEDILGTFKLTK